MKHYLLFLLLLAATMAQAQLLPVPGEKNPDWVLQRKKVSPETQYRNTDRMPNGLLRGIAGMGNHHYHWDSNRQLRYEWESLPERTAPADSVTVHEDATGTIYSYRRTSPQAAPRQWRRIPGK